MRDSQRYEGLVASWRSLARTRNLCLRAVPCGQGCELLVVDLDRTQALGEVALCAGVHGDEPAAPWALLSLVRDCLLDQRFAYRIWCCTNPTGYALGTRTNAQGVDINRSFSKDGRSAHSSEAAAVESANQGRRFLISLDLHEDYEAHGFYCYEPVAGGSAPVGKAVVQAMDDAGLAVEDIGSAFDLGYPAEATHLRSLERGRVLPDIEAEVRHFDGLPYSMHLLWTGRARRTMTLESPRRAAWGDRIATHRVAVVAALETVARSLGNM